MDSLVPATGRGTLGQVCLQAGARGLGRSRLRLGSGLLALAFAAAIFECSAWAASFMPNLTTTTPAGWSGTLVVATQPGQIVDSRTQPPYSINQPLYVSLAVMNMGQAAAGTFQIELDVDGASNQTVTVANGLGINAVFTKQDLQVAAFTTTGNHTFTMKIDSTNAVQETIETDNVFTKLITVSQPLPNLTYTTPAGWSGPVVISTQTGTNTDSTATPPYSTDSPLYVDVAVTNNGTAAAGPCNVVLYLDSAQIGTPVAVTDPQNGNAPGLGVGHTFTIQDTPIGALSHGTHSIQMVIDPPPGQVVEFNENDNSYNRTIQVLYAKPTFQSGTTSFPIAGNFWSYQILASPAIISYNTSGLPNWASVNVNTGLVSGTPPLDAAGPGTQTFPMNVSVSNGDFSASMVVNVSIYPATPVITSPLQAFARLGLPFNYTVTQAGSPANITITPPAQANLVGVGGQSTGTISGTPDQSGVVIFTITATNFAGNQQQTDVRLLEIDIAGPPVFTSALTGISGTIGQPFTYQTGATGNPFYFERQVDQGPPVVDSLPPGLSINKTTGVISGTPTVPGTYIVPLYATNVGGSGTATLVIGIRDGVKPAITSPLTIHGINGAGTVLPGSNLPDYFFYYFMQATTVPADTTWWWVGQGAGTIESGQPSGWEQFTATQTPPIGATRYRYEYDVGALPQGITPVQIERDANPGMGPWVKVNTGELTGKPVEGTKGIWPVQMTATYRDKDGNFQAVSQMLRIVIEGPLPHIITSKITNMPVTTGVTSVLGFTATNPGVPWFQLDLDATFNGGWHHNAAYAATMSPDGAFSVYPGPFNFPEVDNGGYTTDQAGTYSVGLFWHKVWDTSAEGSSLEIDLWPYFAVAVSDWGHNHGPPYHYHPFEAGWDPAANFNQMRAVTVHVGAPIPTGLQDPNVQDAGSGIGAPNADNTGTLQTDGTSSRADGLFGLPNPCMGVTPGVPSLSPNLNPIGNSVFSTGPVVETGGGILQGVPTQAGVWFIRKEAVGTMTFITGNPWMHGFGLTTLRVEHLKADQPIITSPNAVIGKLGAPFVYQFTYANTTLQPKVVCVNSVVLDHVPNTQPPQPLWPLVLPMGLSFDGQRITGKISPSAFLTTAVFGPTGNQAIQVATANGSNRVAVFGMGGGVGNKAFATVSFPNGNPLDGDTLTLNDGAGTANTFEFDNNGGVAAGNVSVPINGADPYQTILNLQNAIPSRGLKISVVQTVRFPAPLIKLQNNFAGAQGNQPIASNDPVNIQFPPQGMSGGSGLGATGRIILPAGNVPDGNQVIIRDGTGKSVTFEFDSGNGVSPGSTSVAIGVDAVASLTNLVNKIPVSGLQMTASVVSNAPPTALLTDNLPGAQGNLAIQTLPLQNADKVSATGMGGGNGTPGSGTIRFPLGNPFDGDTITITDALANAVAFTFTSNPILTTDVGINAGSPSATLQNLQSAIQTSILRMDVSLSSDASNLLLTDWDIVDPALFPMAITPSNPIYVQVTGMANGTAIHASGTVNLLNLQNPNDGDTVTLNDGTTVVVYQFQLSGGVVPLQPGNVAVPINADDFVTIGNLATAINGSGLAITALSHYTAPPPQPQYNPVTQSIGPFAVEFIAYCTDPVTNNPMYSNVFNNRDVTAAAPNGHDTSTRYNFTLEMVFYDQSPNKPTLATTQQGTASEKVPFLYTIVGTQNAYEIKAVSVAAPTLFGAVSTAPLPLPRGLTLDGTVNSSTTIRGAPDIGTSEFWPNEMMQDKVHTVLFQLKGSGVDGIGGNADDTIGFGVLNIDVNPATPIIQPYLDTAPTFGFSNSSTRIVRDLGLSTAQTVGGRLAHKEYDMVGFQGNMSTPDNFAWQFDYLIGTPQAGGGSGAGLGQSRDKDTYWDVYIIAPFEANHGSYYLGNNLVGGLTVDYQAYSTAAGPNNPVNFDGTQPVMNAGFLHGVLNTVARADVLVASQSSFGANTRALTVRSHPIYITSPIQDKAIVGVSYTYQITGTGQPSSYWADGLPPGVQIDPRTGIISGIPLVPSDPANPTNPQKHFECTVYASNAYNTGQQSLCLSVAQIAKAPVIVDPLVAQDPPVFKVVGMDGVVFYNPWVPTRLFRPQSGPYYPPPGGTVQLTNRTMGTAGNQPIVVSAQTAGNIIVQGMSGGAWASQGPPPVNLSAATGIIELGGQNPADGDTITISDGPVGNGQTVTFEFDNNNAVTAGHVQVNIGLTPDVTLSNLTDQIHLSTLNIAAVLDQSPGYRITVASYQYDNSGNPSLDATKPLPQYPPQSYGATAMPTGLGVDPNSGLISGTPVGYGEFDSIITASNIFGIGSQLLHMSIKPAPPMITSSLTGTGYVGRPFSGQACSPVTVTGSQPMTITIGDNTLPNNGLPPGLTANAAVISGTPSPVPTPTSVYNVRVSATNPANTEQKVLLITIYTPPTFRGYRPGALPNTYILPPPPPVVVGTPFTFPVIADGSPENMVINASGLPPGTSFNGTASGTPISGTPTRPGTYVVTLTVTNIATFRFADGTPRFDPGSNLTLTITVNQMQITSPLVAFGTVGVPLPTYQITATGNPTSYTVYGLPQGISFNSFNGQINGFPVVAGTFPVTIGASNGIGQASATLYLVIASASGAPAILPPLVATGYIGDPQPFTYQIRTTNPATSYAVTPVDPNVTLGSLGLHLSHSNDPNDPGGVDGLITGKAVRAGSYEFVISASNAAGTGSATLLIAISTAPGAPAITSPLHEQGLVGAPFHYVVTASNNPITFNATVNGGSLGTIGLSIDQGSGEITGSPNIAGTFTVTLVATNQTGSGQADLILEVLPAAPPIITSGSSATGVVGVPFWYVITATFASSYGADNLPPGLTVDPSTGLISGIPLLRGTYVGDISGISGPRISATNMYGTAYAPLTITIVPAAGAPVITSATLATGIIGQQFSYQIIATNLPNSYNLRPLAPSVIPPGLSVNGQTGQISGVPTTPGTYKVIMIATNAAGMGTEVLTITIATPVPIITSPGVATGTVGVQFQDPTRLGFQLTATGTLPIQFSVSTLPAGLSLVGSTIFGIPTLEGTYNVQVTASNSFGTDTEPLKIIILPPQPPTITSSSGFAITGMVFVPLTYQFAATGSAPITLSTSELPPGLTYANGVISGIPTVAGSYAVTLTGSNVAGTTTQTLTITILPLVPGADNDGDGFPDVVEVFVGTNPLDANSTPFNGLPGTSQPFHMPAPKLAVKLNFAKPNKDNVTLSGTLPVPAGFSAPGETFVLDVGGVLIKAVLDRRGNFVSADRTTTVKLTARKSSVGQNARYTVNLKGSYQTPMAVNGMVNKTITRAAVGVDVLVLLINSELMYQKTQTLLYTAKLNKSGTAR